MFLNNKYKKWYNSIISNAKLKVNIGIVEKHHIIPKSLGGTDDNNNLVLLTPREHFICHLLLIKMTVGINKSKMAAAILLMIKNTNKLLHREKITSRKYDNRRFFRNIKFSDEHRRKLSEAAKKRKPRIPSPEELEKRRQSLLGKNKGKKLSDETKRKISQSKKGHVYGCYSEERRKNISDALIGKLKSDSHKKNISVSKIGKKRKPHTEETKLKISISNRGKHSKKLNLSSDEITRRSELMKKLRAEQTFKTKI